MITPEKLLEAAKQLEPQLQEWRRTLHRHPEVGFDLPQTKALVQKALTEMGYAPQDCGKCGVLALAGGKKPGKVILLRGVDYKTLLFFIGLFISVAGLEQTGVLKLIAQFISSISGGSIKAVIVIILLLSAVCSALIDNIPFAATMVPVIQSIAATQGMDLRVIAWALSLGTDLGGNATPIGASANVVATSVSAKSGHPITWGKYCKYCVPATLLVIAVSLGCLFLRYL